MASISRRAALAELRRANRLGRIAAAEFRRRRMRFEKRLERLEKKTGFGLLEIAGAESRRAPVESNQKGRER